MNNKGIIAVLVLMLLVGGILYMRAGSSEPAPITTLEQPAVEQKNIVQNEPPPSGKVDDILASLDDEQSKEAAAMETENTDTETALSDDSAINDLSQTYDETKL